LVVDTEHYKNVKPLLDDMHLRYVHEKVKPYSYGSQWALCGNNILVPFQWVAKPGTAVKDVDLEWIDSSLEDTWVFNYKLSLIFGQGLERLIGGGVYGVLTNNPNLAGMVNSHPTSTLYMLQHKNIFKETTIKKTDFREFRYRFVYSIPAYRELRGLVFAESEEVAKDPSIIDPVWSVAWRLE
jgi:hypothetical protein